MNDKSCWTAFERYSISNGMPPKRDTAAWRLWVAAWEARAQMIDEQEPDEVPMSEKLDMKEVKRSMEECTNIIDSIAEDMDVHEDYNGDRDDFERALDEIEAAVKRTRRHASKS